MTYNVGMNPYINNQQTGYSSSLGLSSGTGYSAPINMVSGGSSSTASLDPYAMYLQEQGTYDALASGYQTATPSAYASQGATYSAPSYSAPSFAGEYSDPYSMMGAYDYAYDPDPSTPTLLGLLGQAGHLWAKWDYLAGSNQGPANLDVDNLDKMLKHESSFKNASPITPEAPKVSAPPEIEPVLKTGLSTLEENAITDKLQELQKNVDSAFQNLDENLALAKKTSLSKDFLKLQVQETLAKYASFLASQKSNMNGEIDVEGTLTKTYTPLSELATNLSQSLNSIHSDDSANLEVFSKKLEDFRSSLETSAVTNKFKQQAVARTGESAEINIEKTAKTKALSLKLGESFEGFEALNNLRTTLAENNYIGTTGDGITGKPGRIGGYTSITKHPDDYKKAWTTNVSRNFVTTVLQDKNFSTMNVWFGDEYNASKQTQLRNDFIAVINSVYGLDETDIAKMSTDDVVKIVNNIIENTTALQKANNRVKKGDITFKFNKLNLSNFTSLPSIQAKAIVLTNWANKGKTFTTVEDFAAIKTTHKGTATIDDAAQRYSSMLVNMERKKLPDTLAELQTATDKQYYTELANRLSILIEKDPKAAIEMMKQLHEQNLFKAMDEAVNKRFTNAGIEDVDTLKAVFPSVGKALQGSVNTGKRYANLNLAMNDVNTTEGAYRALTGGLDKTSNTKYLNSDTARQDYAIQVMKNIPLSVLIEIAQDYGIPIVEIDEEAKDLDSAKKNLTPEATAIVQKQVEFFSSKYFGKDIATIQQTMFSDLNDGKHHDDTRRANFVDGFTHLPEKVREEAIRLAGFDGLEITTTEDIKNFDLKILKGIAGQVETAYKNVATSDRTFKMVGYNQDGTRKNTTLPSTETDFLNKASWEADNTALRQKEMTKVLYQNQLTAEYYSDANNRTVSLEEFIENKLQIADKWMDEISKNNLNTLMDPTKKDPEKIAALSAITKATTDATDKIINNNMSPALQAEYKKTVGPLSDEKEFKEARAFANALDPNNHANNLLLKSYYENTQEYNTQRNLYESADAKLNIYLGEDKDVKLLALDLGSSPAPKDLKEFKTATVADADVKTATTSLKKQLQTNAGLRERLLAELDNIQDENLKTACMNAIADFDENDKLTSSRPLLEKYIKEEQVKAQETIKNEAPLLYKHREKAANYLKTAGNSEQISGNYLTVNSQNISDRLNPTGSADVSTKVANALTMMAESDTISTKTGKKSYFWNGSSSILNQVASLNSSVENLVNIIGPMKEELTAAKDMAEFLQTAKNKYSANTDLQNLETLCAKFGIDTKGKNWAKLQEEIKKAQDTTNSKRATLKTLNAADLTQKLQAEKEYYKALEVLKTKGKSAADEDVENVLKFAEKMGVDTASTMKIVAATTSSPAKLELNGVVLDEATLKTLLALQNAPADIEVDNSKFSQALTRLKNETTKPSVKTAEIKNATVVFQNTAESLGIKGKFELKDKALQVTIAGKTIKVVDDITTGITLSDDFKKLLPQNALKANSKGDLEITTIRKSLLTDFGVEPANINEAMNALKNRQPNQSISQVLEKYITKNRIALAMDEAGVKLNSSNNLLDADDMAVRQFEWDELDAAAKAYQDNDFMSKAIAKALFFDNPDNVVKELITKINATTTTPEERARYEKLLMQGVHQYSEVEQALRTTLEQSTTPNISFKDKARYKTAVDKLDADYTTTRTEVPEGNILDAIKTAHLRGEKFSIMYKGEQKILDWNAAGFPVADGRTDDEYKQWIAKFIGDAHATYEQVVQEFDAAKTRMPQNVFTKYTEFEKVKNSGADPIKVVYYGNVVEIPPAKLSDITDQPSLTKAIQEIIKNKGSFDVIIGGKKQTFNNFTQEGWTQFETEMKNAQKQFTQTYLPFTDKDGNKITLDDYLLKITDENGLPKYYKDENGVAQKITDSAHYTKALEGRIADLKEQIRVNSNSDEIAGLQRALDAANKALTEFTALTPEQQAERVKTAATSTPAPATESGVSGDQDAGKGKVNPSKLQEINELRKQIENSKQVGGDTQALEEELKKKVEDFNTAITNARTELAKQTPEKLKELSTTLKEAAAHHPDTDLRVVINSLAKTNKDFENLKMLADCDGDFLKALSQNINNDDVIGASLKKQDFATTRLAKSTEFGTNFKQEFAQDFKNKYDWGVTAVQAVGTTALAAYNEYQATGQVGEATMDAAIVGSAEAVGGKLGGDVAGSIARAALSAAGKSGNGWAMLASAAVTCIGGFLGTKLFGNVAQDMVKD